jgi:hypothetical protein
MDIVDEEEDIEIIDSLDIKKAWRTQKQTCENSRNEKEKKGNKKGGPHWVVQPCCRRFNSAGPHHVFHVFVHKRQRDRLSMTEKKRNKECL